MTLASPAALRRCVILAAAAGAAALGLAGCGSLFQSKATVPAVYLLSVRPATRSDSGANSTSLPADLAVARPRVRAGLNTDRIAVLYPDRRLDYFAAARWSGPLDQVVQDLAVQAFRCGARLRNVSADTSAFSSTHWLEIEASDFQAEYSAAGGAPTIRVRLSARLGLAADRRVLGSFDAQAVEPASNNRLTAIVDAYERAADAALSQIVAGAVQTLAASEQR